MASGDFLCKFHPYHNEPPSTAYATLDWRNGHPVLDFDGGGSTNESAVFTDVMPPNYSGGGTTVLLFVALSTATTGDTDWDVSFERIGDQVQDIDSDGFATVQSTDNTTVPGTSGLVDVISITFTNGAQMDSVIAGDLFRLKVTRDDISDTAAGDAELLMVVVKET